MLLLVRVARPVALLATSGVALLAWAGMLAAESDATGAVREGARRAAMAGALAVQEPVLRGDVDAAAAALAVAGELDAPLALHRAGTRVAGPDLGADAVHVRIAYGDWTVAAPLVDDRTGLGLTRASGPITAVSLAVFLSSSIGLVVATRRSRARVRDLEARFDAVAAADESTGLGNRARLLEDLEALSGSVVRYGHRLAVLSFELDGSFGEDDVRAVARIVAGEARSADRCYRLPGGRLVSVLPEQDERSAELAAERIRAVIRATGAWTVSAGVAVFEPHRDIAPSDVLDRALAASHRAHATA